MKLTKQDKKLAAPILEEYNINPEYLRGVKDTNECLVIYWSKKGDNPRSWASIKRNKPQPSMRHNGGAA